MTEYCKAKCPKCGTDMENYVVTCDPPIHLSRCPMCGFEKKVDPFVADEQPEKPPLGVTPADLAAWRRIANLADAIRRQYESQNGNAKLVKKWANEITWQCALIESMEEDE